MTFKLSSHFLLTIVCVLTSTMTAIAERPYVVSHRGLLRQIPENTLPAFRACLDLRVGFEFDVRRTKDGVLVCVHDPTMKRTSNITGKIENLTFEEIRAADIGGWFDVAYAGQQVPTIEEIFQLIAEYKDLDLIFPVDIKVKGTEEELIQLAEKYDILHRLLFIGLAKSDINVRKKLVSLNSKVESTVFATEASEFETALNDPYGTWVHFRYVPTREEIAAVTKAGKRTYIGLPPTIPHVPDLWKQMTDYGISAILTDYTIELREQLRQPVGK